MRSGAHPNRAHSPELTHMQLMQDCLVLSHSPFLVALLLVDDINHMPVADTRTSTNLNLLRIEILRIVNLNLLLRIVNLNLLLDWMRVQLRNVQLAPRLQIEIPRRLAVAEPVPDSPPHDKSATRARQSAAMRRRLGRGTHACSFSSRESIFHSGLLASRRYGS